MAIYPNPVNNIFTINLEATELHIYDVSGKIVKQFNGSFDKYSSFDVRDLTSGIYFVQIKSIDGSAYSLKFLKE